MPPHQNIRHATNPIRAFLFQSASGLTAGPVLSSPVERYDIRQVLNAHLGLSPSIDP
jgi:hypothetical protein